MRWSIAPADEFVEFVEFVGVWILGCLDSDGVIEVTQFTRCPLSVPAIAGYG